METINRIFILIASGIYTLASWTFQLFFVLARGKILSEADYKGILDNVYLILGVIILFMLSFFLLKTMVNPDDQSKTATNVKKVIINLVSSGVIIAFLPTIFSFAFDFQNAVMSYNVIGGFFGYGTPNFKLPINDSDEEVCRLDEEIQLESKVLVDGVFTAFFNISNDVCPGDITKCQAEIQAKDSVAGLGNLSFLETSNLVKSSGNWKYYEAFAGNVVDKEVDLNYLLIIIGGLLLVYVGVSFCFDMALRLVKLVFYQVIAPFPVFCRVIPEGNLSNVFGKWVKITLTCYLEVFIRIIVIYFCIYTCKAMLSSSFINTTIANCNLVLYLFAKAFIILGLVMFMRQVPKLFSEVTGIDSGNMKLGIKEKLKDGGFFAATNAVGGLVGGLAGSKNFLSGVSGAYQGFKHGWSNANLNGIGNAYARGYEYREARRSGAPVTQIWADSFRRDLGLPTWVDMQERRIDQSDETIDSPLQKDLSWNDDQGRTYTMKANQTGYRLTYRGYEALDTEIARKKDQIKSYVEGTKIMDKAISSDDERISNFNGKMEDKINEKIDEEGSAVTGIRYTKHIIANDIGGGNYEFVDDTGAKRIIKNGDTIKYKGKDYFDAQVELDGRIKVKDSAGNFTYVGDNQYFGGNWAQFNEWQNSLSDNERRQINQSEARENLMFDYATRELASADPNAAIKGIYYDEVDEQLLHQNNTGGRGRFVRERDPRTGAVKYSEIVYDGKKWIEYETDSNNKRTGNIIKNISDDFTNSAGQLNPYKVSKYLKGKFAADKSFAQYEKRQVQRTNIDPIQEEIENLQAVKDVFESKKEARKQDPRIKRGKASSKYVGNRKS